MAYGVKWDAYKSGDCIRRAELQALVPGRTGENGFLYRFDDVSYSQCIDPDGDLYGSYTQVELTAYIIKNYTPMGCQIYAGTFRGNTRFVNFFARKQFACRTIEDARISFVARKEKQISIYQNRAAKAQLAIDLLGPKDSSGLPKTPS